jgi:hypothetical protein
MLVCFSIVTGTIEFNAAEECACVLFPLLAHMIAFL